MTQDKSLENLQRQAEQAKEEATAKFRKKAEAFESALKVRMKNPTIGLPRSVSQFLAWKGVNQELDDITSSRSSLNDPSRSELKQEIQALINTVKHPPISGGVDLEKYKALAETRYVQLRGLAATNQALESEIDDLKQEIQALLVERDRLLKQAKSSKASANVVRLP